MKNETIDNKALKEMEYKSLIEKLKENKIKVYDDDNIPAALRQSDQHEGGTSNI